MDVLKTIEPRKQQIIEVDHWAGHAKYRENGFHVSNMNVRYGGKQKALRDTIICNGCLGPAKANMHLNNGKLSTDFVEGVSTRTVGFKLKVGETPFATNAPPPFYDWEAPKRDIKVGTRAKRTGKRKRGSDTGDGAGTLGEDEGNQEERDGIEAERVVDVTKEGYVGKAKGMKQVLWERGWWVNGMSASEKYRRRMRKLYSVSCRIFGTRGRHCSTWWKAGGTFRYYRRNGTRRL